MQLDDEPPSENSFFLSGLSLICNKKRKTIIKLNQTNLKTFKEAFGATPLVLFKCWELLVRHIFSRANRVERLHPNHLLWACLFMKTYSKESIHSSVVGCSPKTYRFWGWTAIEFMADLEPFVVSPETVFTILLILYIY
jgi:hypothetical protein